MAPAELRALQSQRLRRWCGWCTSGSRTTGRSSTRPACAPTTSVTSGTSPNSPSPPRRPARDISLRDARGAHGARWCASMPPRGPPASDGGRLHARGHRHLGGGDGPHAGGRRACTGADVVQNAYGYGLFTGGLGLHYGAELIGAIGDPDSGGQHGAPAACSCRTSASTVLCCTPSYALVDRGEGQGDGRGLRDRCRCGWGSSAPSRGPRACAQDDREPRWGWTRSTSTGSAEIIGPGVAYECLRARHGLHVFEDHFYPESSTRHRRSRCRTGEQGELVFTTLTKEALPLIRYRTRDITAL